jgi:hypothetical protein
MAVAEPRRSVQQGGASTTGDVGRLKALWKAVKDFVWGLAFLEMYRETLKERRKYEDVLNIVLLGEFLGIPLMNSTITLKLLPHLFPELKHWRQRQLTERDITDHLPDAHLH